MHLLVWVDLSQYVGDEGPDLMLTLLYSKFRVGSGS